MTPASGTAAAYRTIVADPPWDVKRLSSPGSSPFGAGGTPLRSVPLPYPTAPMGLGPGGAYSITTEYVLFGTRGSLPPVARSDRTAWSWKRGRHSAKPDAFLDVVEQVSPGPYLEVFARRARFGWDYAGDGSLGTVTIPGLRAPGEQEQAA